MSKNNKFYVKKIKKDNITVAEEKNYKSPFILFLVANGRLIFIITLLLSITTLIISTSLVFRNMLGSTYKSDKNNTNTTTDNSNVVVTVDISDECNLNNTTPITEEYATKLFDSSRQINTANTGVVIKVKEKTSSGCEEFYQWTYMGETFKEKISAPPQNYRGKGLCVL